MNNNGQGRRKTTVARSLALVGIMAATVECGKLALSFVPNVEVVTVLLALYGYVFGFHGVFAALIFVSVEPLIWGFGTWMVSYYIYWPIVAIVFLILGKAKIKNRIVITVIAAVLTFFFGVLTSLVDIGLLSGFFDNFWYRFGIYYARGAIFYAVHIVSNTIIFISLFKLLEKKLEEIKKRIFV